MTSSLCFFFFNDTATTEIYTLSLHDALPISLVGKAQPFRTSGGQAAEGLTFDRSINSLSNAYSAQDRSEEHTSELQSRQYLVCRLLLEKKNKTATRYRECVRDYCLQLSYLCQ